MTPPDEPVRAKHPAAVSGSNTVLSVIEPAIAATFAIFATSFIARPVGAVVVGRRADHLSM